MPFEYDAIVGLAVKKAHFVGRSSFHFHAPLLRHGLLEVQQHIAHEKYDSVPELVESAKNDDLTLSSRLRGYFVKLGVEIAPFDDDA